MAVSEELIQLVVLPVLLVCVTGVIIAMRIGKAIERKALLGMNAAAGKGDGTAEEILRTLSKSARNRTHGLSTAQRDRRSGILWLSGGIGLGILTGCLAFVFEATLNAPLFAAGVTAFPGAIGIAYLLLARAAGSDA